MYKYVPERSTTMSDGNAKKAGEEVTKLLMMILKKLFGVGKDEEKKKMDEILKIAAEMLSQQMEKNPGLFSPKALGNKNPDTMAALADIVTAATAAQGVLSANKKGIGDLLEQRKDQKNQLSKLTPGSPEHNKLKKDLKETEDKIKTEFKELNKQDPNETRRNNFDKNIDNPDFFDKFDKAKDGMGEISKTMREGQPLSDSQDKSLTASLTNLHGMDPRIEGAGVAPVTQVIGNEMGIPDNNPAFTAFEPLHAMSGAKDNASHEAQKTGKDLEAEKVNDAVNQVLDSDEGKELTRSSPTPAPPKPGGGGGL
jgi:hypothetical protein